MKEWNKNDSFVYATRKIDGWTLRISKDKNGNISTVSKTGKPLDVSQCAFMVPVRERMTADSVIIGELHVTGKPASEISRRISKRQEMELAVFALPIVSGIDLARESLGTVQNIVKQWGLEYVRWERFESRTPAAWLERVNGFEGWVFKDCNYNPDTERKLKPLLTTDLRVVGFNDGKGKYSGFVGSLVCADGSGKIVANVGGFSDAMRHAINRNDDMGRILEVAYQCIGPNGKLRHPRFLRWREDLAA